MGVTGQWEKQLSETKEGCKRSTSASPHDHPHPQLQHFPLESKEVSDSSPSNISVSGKSQDAYLIVSARLNHKLWRFGIDSPTYKDVDGVETKMRETSSVARKRRSHQHSNEISPPIVVEEFSPHQSPKRVNTSASPSVSDPTRDDKAVRRVSASLAPLTPV
jgi:hypothetical protein